MIGSEICAAARKLAPKIQLRDVSMILRQMEKRRLVQCLNPGRTSGQLFCFTPKGRRLMKKAFEVELPPPPEGIDWRSYSFVVRAKVRRLTLTALAAVPLNNQEGIATTDLRNRSPTLKSISWNAISRAVAELRGRRLLVTSKNGVRPQRLRTSRVGQSIVNCLNQ